MPLAPEVTIDPPQSGISGQGLLRSALVIDHDANPDQSRWGAGIAFSPDTCADADVIDPCAITNGMDAAANRPVRRTYTPFTVDAHDTCSTFGWQRADYEARARRMMAARESKAVELEFWTGALNPLNPHLADGAGAAVPAGGTTVTTVGTAMSPKNGLSKLVQAIADANGGAGMLHMRPRMLEILVDAGHLRYENGQWYTARGVKVVAGDGYPGTGPAAEPITATTEWVFGTDLVEVHRGPVEVFAKALTSESVSYQSNSETVRAQRLYAAIWNGCALVAASILVPATDV